MRISIEEMHKLHEKQLEMWEVLDKLLTEMNIRYYFVHGSLLGAFTRKGFIDEDDDIDIAVFRNDYTRLIMDGNNLLDHRYFIQSSITDDFPLAFAKFRDSETTFIQPILENYHCNSGCYIDIFPIDYCEEDNRSLSRIVNKLYQIKINARIKNVSHWRLRQIVAFFIPLSCKYAIRQRERYYASLPPADNVCLTGGKREETRIPKEWFGNGVDRLFEGYEVKCPDNSEAYLRRIYGDNYKECNPANDRLDEQGNINISASIMDLDKSYKEYLR